MQMSGCQWKILRWSPWTRSWLVNETDTEKCSSHHQQVFQRWTISPILICNSTFFPTPLIHTAMAVKPVDPWNTCLNTTLEEEDKEVFAIVENEKLRQWSGLELIASEVWRRQKGYEKWDMRVQILMCVIELHLPSCYWSQWYSFDQQVLWRSSWCSLLWW